MIVIFAQNKQNLTEIRKNMYTRLICKNIPSSFSPNVPFSKLQLGKISFLSLQEMALFALKVGRIAPSIHFEMGFFIPNVLWNGVFQPKCTLKWGLSTKMYSEKERFRACRKKFPIWPRLLMYFWSVACPLMYFFVACAPATESYAWTIQGLRLLVLLRCVSANVLFHKNVLKMWFKIGIIAPPFFA